MTVPLHVVPSVGSDEFQHEMTEDCMCGPRLEPVEREDGSIGWIVAHHALDGRK